MKSFSYIIQKIWQFAIGVSVVLLPQLALAQSVSDGVKIQSLTPPMGDLSIVLLGRIFGTVGGGLETVSPTIFGQMFYVFNSGILITIGLILIYTTFKSVMEIAHGDNSQMGRKFSWWQMARVVLGIGAIVPQSTGYASIQTLIIWVVIQGVGLADAVWSQAVNYLAQGGELYSVPAIGSTIQLIDDKLIFDHRSPAEDTCYHSGSPGCATSADILNASVCMDYLYKVVEASRTQRLADALSDNGMNYTPADIKALRTITPRFVEAYDENSWTVIFPGNADKVIPPPGTGKKDVNLNGVCGKYTWGRVPTDGHSPWPDPGPPIPPTSDDLKNYRSAKEAGIRQMVLGLSQIADDSVNLYDAKDTIDFPASFRENAYTALVNTAANYQSIIQPMRLYASSGYNPSPRKSELDPDYITKNGWIGAGSFYFTLARVLQLVGEYDKYYYAAISSENPFCTFLAGCNNAYNNTITSWFIQYLGDPVGKVFLKKLKDRLIWVVPVPPDSNEIYRDIYHDATSLAADLNNTAQKNNGDVYLPDVLKEFILNNGIEISMPVKLVQDGNAVVEDLGFSNVWDQVISPLNTSLNSVTNEWYTLFIQHNSNSGKFPLLRVQQLGQSMINSFFNYWVAVFKYLGDLLQKYYNWALIRTSVSAGVAAGSWLGMTEGVSILEQTLVGFMQVLLKTFVEIPLSVALPLASSVTILLLLNGVVLAFYIPMLPFMLFLFGTISWFSFVIEAMVAGPLVALGITHPEGHDLLGKAEQTLMLLIAVFVRPTVMIFGLIAGMVLSYVSLDVLNSAYGQIISQGSNFFNAAAGGATTQVQSVALILIYTFIVMSLMQQCFSLIHSLPNAIMTWIGLHHREGQEAQLAEAVKTGLTSAAERAGGGVGQAASAMHPGGLKGEAIKGGKDKEEEKGGANIQGLGGGAAGGAAG